MKSETVFRTESIDLAAFLVAAGHEPQIYRAPDGKRALFEFFQTEELLKAIVGFEGGSSLPAKRLLSIRNRLFREASQAVKGGACSWSK